MKFCGGCGQKLEVTTEHWFFRDGKPVAPCRTCRAAKKTQHDGPYGWVPASKVYPLMVELVVRCGGVPAASRVSEINENTIREIMGRKRPRTQKRTVRLVVIALYEKRKEDRRNGGNQYFLEMKKQQALKEEKMNRLAGY
jgi:hypothetical protein